MFRKARRDPVKHFFCSFYIGLSNGKQFKATVKCRIGFNKFSVFIIGGCTDHGDLTTCKLRLKQVRCTPADTAILMIKQGMDFIYKKNCFWELLYLPDDILEAVFNFTFIGCPCDQRSKIKLK